MQDDLIPNTRKLKYDPWPWQPINFWYNGVLLARWCLERGVGRLNDDDRSFCYEIANQADYHKVPEVAMARLRAISSPLRWV